MNLDAPFHVGLVHRFRVTRHALDPASDVLRAVLVPPADGRARCVAFFDAGLTALQPALPDLLRRYAAAAGTIELVAVHTVPGGESCKNDPELLQQVLRQVHDARICRQSYVLAIGGGAVLDLVGYAAAITHRGVRLIRLPSTTLSQCDSGVGVKNGINAFGKKNFLGTFAAPWAVINDVALLQTLPEQDWRAGFSEILKVALVKDAELFERLTTAAERVAAGDFDAALPLIERSAELHLRHIVGGGDPYELSSARPLDFGHWAAHRLEQITDFRLRHGEAVAIGIALDVSYAAHIGLLPRTAAERVFVCLRRLRLPTFHAAMRDDATVLAGIEEFREHLGGRLTIGMIRDIGCGVDVHAIDVSAMLRALDEIASLP